MNRQSSGKLARIPNNTISTMNARLRTRRSKLDQERFSVCEGGRLEDRISANGVMCNSSYHSRRGLPKIFH